MSTRDQLLKRWVKQPPAEPIVQYLRDYEREAAVEKLDNAEAVLDVASEVGVADSLESAKIIRVDFSESASEHARHHLGDSVAEYYTTDPGTPSLDITDDRFEVAVSIGPYDWRFLDTEELTREIHRVLVPYGTLVYSVPTPNSPYAVNGKTLLRYFTPIESQEPISPHWSLEDTESVFQYPFLLNGAVRRLPGALQGIFVDTARRASVHLSEHDWQHRASYLVHEAQSLPYRRLLEDALETTFRPTGENGFWDDDQSGFVRALDYRWSEGELVWTPQSRDGTWRYVPFLLMGLLQWRTSVVGSEHFDQQLRVELETVREQLIERQRIDEVPSYGLGPLIVAYSLADEVFDGDYIDTAIQLYEYSVDTFDFSDSEDTLLLYGWTYLYEATGLERVHSTIEDTLWTVIDREQPLEGVLVFENPTTGRHQNQMYSLWGICRAIEVLNEQGYLENVERILDYTIENRMREDGGIIWEDRSLPVRTVGKLRRVGRETSPPYWDLLFSCHQTFFVNAVAHYYRAGGTRNYDVAVRRAMEWIYSTNIRDENLVTCSGVGVPMRFMTTDGGMDLPDQRFKGAYEVGSYLMALTNLLEWPKATSRDNCQIRDGADEGQI